MPSTSIPESSIPVPVKSRGGKRSKGFAKLDAIGDHALMAVSYETLRTYASKGMQIVGASRIKGGKLSLVQAIMRARK